MTTIATKVHIQLRIPKPNNSIKQNYRKNRDTLNVAQRKTVIVGELTKIKLWIFGPEIILLSPNNTDLQLLFKKRKLSSWHKTKLGNSAQGNSFRRCCYIPVESETHTYQNGIWVCKLSLHRTTNITKNMTINITSLFLSSFIEEL